MVLDGNEKRVKWETMAGPSFGSRLPPKHDAFVVRLAQLGLSALVAIASPVAFAQLPKAGTAPAHGAPPSSSAIAPRTAAAADGGAGVLETKTLDGGTRSFKFSELDIEGRLKSPQLVYFLRRIRAEFAAGDLGHRPFLGEMSETRKEPGL
jgi:hypothetical protein